MVGTSVRLVWRDTSEILTGQSLAHLSPASSVTAMAMWTLRTLTPATLLATAAAVPSIQQAGSASGVPQVTMAMPPLLETAQPAAAALKVRLAPVIPRLAAAPVSPVW